MKQFFSNSKDCYLLARKLEKKLGNKINFISSTHIDVPYGNYLSLYRRNNGENMINGKKLPFYFKFSENEFLRIGVGSNSCGSSIGEKMAALSDFYEILSEEYGNPTVFYTTENDCEEFINLQWSFINEKEEINKFKSGTYFDDAKVDTLVIISENKNNDISDKTKDSISRNIGLPYNLLYLFDKDIENYVKHKKGKEINIPMGAKIDSVPLVSMEKKLVKKKNM